MKPPSPPAVTHQLRLALPRGAEGSLRDYLPGPNLEPLQALREVSSGRLRGSLHLWGAAATGKSHLLRAMCSEFPFGAARWLEETPEKLTDRTECGLTCVDNLELLAGQPQKERGLLTLYDTIRARGGILLTASRVAPAQLPLQLPDLRSRISWGLVFRLRHLSDAELAELLRCRAQRRGLRMPEAAAHYLLRRAPRDLHSLCALLDRLDQATPGRHRRLDIPFLREQLAAAGHS